MCALVATISFSIHSQLTNNFNWARVVSANWRFYCNVFNWPGVTISCPVYFSLCTRDIVENNNIECIRVRSATGQRSTQTHSLSHRLLPKDCHSLTKRCQSDVFANCIYCRCYHVFCNTKTSCCLVIRLGNNIFLFQLCCSFYFIASCFLWAEREEKLIINCSLFLHFPLNRVYQLSLYHTQTHNVLIILFNCFNLAARVLLLYFSTSIRSVFFLFRNTSPNDCLASFCFSIC